jgi:hypothetical protein
MPSLGNVRLKVLRITGVWISFSRLQTSPNLQTSIFTRQDKKKKKQNKKQLAKNIERVSEKEKNPRQTGKWVCIFTRQS